MDGDACLLALEYTKMQALATTDQHVPHSGRAVALLDTQASVGPTPILQRHVI